MLGVPVPKCRSTLFMTTDMPISAGKGCSSNLSKNVSHIQLLARALTFCISHPAALVSVLHMMFEFARKPSRRLGLASAALPGTRSDERAKGCRPRALVG